MSGDISHDSCRSDRSEDEALLLAFILGEQGETEQRSLVERLKGDAGLRELYGSMIEMEAMIHHEFPHLAELRELSPPVRYPERIGRFMRPGGGQASHGMIFNIIGGIAAILALLAVVWLLVREDAKPVLVDVSGESFWMDEVGHKIVPQPGQRMEKARALVTGGAGAYATLRFPDGSMATLSGEGELRFRNDGAKRLMLGRGVLEVQMSPQPKGRPAIVETSTAKVEVIGTRFSIDAMRESTKVAVSEGKVKLKRLADGHSVEVSHGRIALASMDVHLDLDTSPFMGSAAVWGVSRSYAGDDLEVRPFRAGRYPDGRLIIHYGAWFRNPDRNSFEGLVGLKSTSRIQVKFRVGKAAAHVRVFLVCRDGHGMSSRNLQLQLPAASAPEDVDGWKVLEMNVRDMEVLGTAGRFEIEGMRAVDLCVAAIEASDQLELSSVSISN